MSIRDRHRWSGWPGAYCLDCGVEDALENAMALDWIDIDENDETTWKHSLLEKYVIFLNTHCLAGASPEEIEAYKKEVAVFEEEARKEGGEVMLTLELQIINSTHNPSKVSLRPLNRATSEIRAELTAAGFQPGDRVMVIKKEDYQRLVRLASHNDETVETGVPIK